MNEIAPLTLNRRYLIEALDPPITTQSSELNSVGYIFTYGSLNPLQWLLEIHVKEEEDGGAET